MKITLAQVLSAAKAASSLFSAVPEVVAVFTAAAGTLTEPADQASAQETIAELAADNDAGKVRLDAKLDKIINGG